MPKIAVILFNLGGADSLKAVKPFLFNLFNDKNIITLPKLPRYILAKFISSRREKKAQKLYSYLGGKSPILEQTQNQADALEKALNGDNSSSENQYKAFISMRYWHPFSDEAVQKVKEYAPDEIILLPLYPQYSSTTTGSSLADWARAAAKYGLVAPTKIIRDYPDEGDFIAAHTEIIGSYYSKAYEFGLPRILFSAHGLPEKIIENGDPYQSQIERSSHIIASKLGVDGLDYVICYQSKVGKLKWLEPSTESEIIRAAKDQVPIIIVPISFVSEHLETLVELDIEYKELAKNNGLEHYFRIPALSTNPLFIKSLANLCRKAG